MAQCFGICMLVVSTVAAQAATLDEVTVAAQGADVVVSISFLATVRLVQQTPVTTAKFFQIQVELSGLEDISPDQLIEESKRVAASRPMPEVNLVLKPAQNQRIRQMTLTLSESATVRARQGNSRTIELVFVGRGDARVADKTSDRRYMVQLDRGPTSEINKLPSVPRGFDQFEVFSKKSVLDGVETFEVNLGYFPSATKAEDARKVLLQRFPNARVVDATAQSNVAQTAVADALADALAPSAAAEMLVQASVVASPEVEARALLLMTNSRESIATGKNDAAIDSLNQLLRLPPNSASQEAQELIGVAWERSSDMPRAKVEYTLYLKLFPASEATQRVAQRLVSMGDAPINNDVPANAVAADVLKPSNTKFTGNLAQYYFGGKTRSQSLVNLAAGIDQSTLTKTTESALVTNLDLGARHTTEDSEFRAVVRGTGSANLTYTSRNSSLLNAAYVDYKQLGSGLAMRAGRQSAINGGLLGMFDGLSLTYPISQSMRVNMMGGVPANALVSAPAERLLAAVVEADSLGEHWGGDAYIIDQTTEGISNRRAMGAEVHYADERGSMYALVDYDQLFHVINAVSLQASIQGPAQTTYTLLVDSRKAPSLQLTNALISTGAASLTTLLQMKSLDEVMMDARSNSAQANQVLLSVARPLNDKWQISGDLRYSQIDALPAVGDFEATPATGAQYGATLQLTGSNLYSKRDINNFNVSILSTPFFKGTQLAYNNLTGFDDNKYTVEPSIRLYSQQDAAGSSMLRISPGLRGSYRYSKRVSLLAEGMIEHSQTKGLSSEDSTDAVFLYLGFRYELF